MSRKLHEIGSDVDPVADHRVASGKAGSATINSTWTKILAWIKANISGSEILAKLLLVDGSGSGLDADLLDGNHASAFQGALTNPITGTGTTNYISKWTSSSTHGNSQIFDNGTDIGIGTATPDAKIDIRTTDGSGVLSDLLNLVDTGSGVNNGSKIKFGYATNIINANIYAQSVAGGGGKLVLGVAASDGDTPTDVLELTKTANAGIGITPEEKLDVNGKGYFRGDLHSEGDIIAYSTLH